MTNQPITTDSLRAELASAPGADEGSRAAAAERAAQILRPAGAMQRLDDVAVHMAAWLRTPTPAVERPAAVIFAADHGVAADGVSAYPTEVTGAMLAAFQARKASVSALAEVAGATVTAIDVGVGNPTGNLRHEPALDPQRFAAAFDAGRASVAELDTDLLILGEMGIGNTTAAAAVTAALLGGDHDVFVGRGTGLDDAALATKAGVVGEALARIAGVSDPLEILREVGGAELVAIAGAMTEARLRSIPVLLDGYIASAPALALHVIDPMFVANALAGHASAEPGHARVLAALARQPLLTLDLRLGEASGAMAAVPLVKMACKLLTDVPTFPEWFGPAED
jgi:nicotinate-nucleotide--dimethylbenzimidazole phosphoribosyltransferase